MLRDYKGPPNSPEMIKSIVGDTIKTIFVEGDTLYIITVDGPGMAIKTDRPIWLLTREDIGHMIDIRREQIQRELDALNAIPMLTPPKKPSRGRK